MANSVIGIILARGGSKGVPGKNILRLHGKPLIAWSIEQLFNAGINRVVVSTDSDEIADVALEFGSEVLRRPPLLATDEASGDEAILHAVEALQLEPTDWVLMPQATSPLRSSQMVADFVNFTLEGPFDSAFSACRIDDVSVWRQNIKLESLTYDVNGRLPRQLRPPTYVENGSLYLTRVSTYQGSGNRIGESVGVFEMPRWTLTEIDDPLDVKICESLMTTFMLEGSDDD